MNPEKEIVNGAEEENPLLQKKAGKRKIPWSKIYILATAVAIALFGVLNNEFRNVFQILSGLKLGYIFLAIVTLLVFYALEGEIIRLLMKSQGIPIGIREGFKIGFIGLYYSAVTPGASGGQPMQSAYLLRDNKVPAGVSTAVLIIKFFAYQTAFSISGLIAFLYMYDRLVLTAPGLIPLMVLGLCINGGSVFFFGFLFYKPFFGVICRFLKWLIRRFPFFSKNRRIFRTIDKFEKDFGSYTEDFHKKKKSVLLAILLSFPEFIAQMSVIYFIMLAFGYAKVSYPQVLSVQAILEAMVSFTPTPGAAGAEELGFRELFGQYFVNNDLFTAMIIWRFFHFYVLIIGGGIVVVIDQMIYDKRMAKQKALAAAQAGENLEE